MAATKKDKTTDTTVTEQPTDRESTADAPEAPALAESNQNASGIEDKADDTQTLDQDKTPSTDTAEINQSADGVEDKTDDTKALDQDKTPPIGGSAPESTAQGDKNPPAGDAGDDGGDEIPLIAMRRDAVTDGGPDTADVHPDEVENWRVHGWEIDPLADGFQIHDPNS